MTLLLILVYTLTLVNLALTERVKRYIYLLSLQGALLFGIAYFHLRHIDWYQLLFIMLETLVVKTILIPVFLNRIRKKNNLHRLRESHVPIFFSVIIVGACIMGSFMLSHFMHEDHVQAKFFSVGIASILTGLFFVIAHRSVFNHLVGYLVFENGIFLLSLAAGAEMPMLINTAILLDVVVGILALGMFLNRMKDYFHEMGSQNLSNLKD
jgi:hydrogenase-4 component E